MLNAILILFKFVLYPVPFPQSILYNDRKIREKKILKQMKIRVGPSGGPWTRVVHELGPQGRSMDPGPCFVYVPTMKNFTDESKSPL